MRQKVWALWGYSNFSFESNNGALRNYVNGTNNVERQIVSRYLYNDTLTKSITENSFFPSTVRAKVSKKIELITLFGEPFLYKAEEVEISVLHVPQILCYKKFHFNNIIFNSQPLKKNARTQLSNDRTVKLTNNTYGEIRIVYKVDDTVFALLKQFRVDSLQCRKHLLNVKYYYDALEINST